MMHSHAEREQTGNALLVVDMQNDFIVGTMPVPGAHDIVSGICYMMDSNHYDHVFVSRCMHPEDHCSFKKQGGQFEVHCVAGTYGAQLHPAIDAIVYRNLRHRITEIQKGTQENKEEFSAFLPKFTGIVSVEVSLMHEALLRKEIKHLDIVGVARNFCVAASYEDAIRLGKGHYTVAIIEHLTRSV